jgi:hypothetical protein
VQLGCSLNEVYTWLTLHVICHHLEDQHPHSHQESSSRFPAKLKATGFGEVAHKVVVFLHLANMGIKAVGILSMQQVLAVATNLLGVCCSSLLFSSAAAIPGRAQITLRFSGATQTN